MKTIELSLSPKYVSGWGVEEAVREILQNAIDQKADGAEVSVSYDRETLSILTDGARLKTSTLLLGESGKDDERYIGKYGEGYKLALLVLTRERKPVKVVTDAETWTPEFRLSETFGEESLQIDVEETGVPGGEFTEFRIGGISPAMMRSFGDRFIALERFMSRDIVARLELFGADDVEFRRLALNLDQIEEFGPPPNPTKLSDSRAQGYIERFGYECWELDALDPSVISRLIDENVRMYRDEGLYRDVLMRENEEKGTLRDLRDGYQGLIQNWSEICENYDIYQ